MGLRFGIRQEPAEHPECGRRIPKPRRSASSRGETTMRFRRSWHRLPGFRKRRTQACGYREIPRLRRVSPVRFQQRDTGTNLEPAYLFTLPVFFLTGDGLHSPTLWRPRSSRYEKRSARATAPAELALARPAGHVPLWRAFWLISPADFSRFASSTASGAAFPTTARRRARTDPAAAPCAARALPLTTLQWD